MEIKEENLATQPNGPEIITYNFDFIGSPEFSNELLQKLLQWGLSQTFKILKFRFNMSFSDVNNSAFISDFFNSKTVKGHLQHLGYLQQFDHFENFKFKKLKCKEVTLNVFDIFEEIGVVSANGDLRKTWGEMVEGIDIVDKLREVLIFEESEMYEELPAETRNELLIHLLEIVVLGGSLNQYEDKINPYKEAVKEIYKNLVSVKTDSSTNNIFVETIPYQILQINVIYFL